MSKLARSPASDEIPPGKKPIFATTTPPPAEVAQLEIFPLDTPHF
jgi:hypothetical protein